jgi:hypothetical protein
VIKVELHVSGDEIFPLAATTKTRRKSAGGGRETVRHPFLHKVAANTLNLCALSAQKSVRERMDEIFKIRIGKPKPSFIQHQVKITKVVKPTDFPNLETTLEVQPNAKSNRKGIPLILDTLELGSIRRPFKGKRWAVPITETAREDGTERGQVKKAFRFTQMQIRLRKIAVVNKEGKKTGKVRDGMFGRPGAGIFQIKGKRGVVYVKHYSKADKKSETIYKADPVPKIMKKMLGFFSTATKAIANVAQKHFSALVSSMGDDRGLKP